MDTTDNETKNPTQRKRIIDDWELDDLFEEFNKTSLILAREINDPHKDYLEMYHDLEAQLSKEDALRQMYIFFKNLLSADLKGRSDTEVKTIVIKIMMMYKIL